MSPAPTATMSPHKSALSRMFAEAGRFLDQSDYAPAIEILERAHRLDPTNCKIVLDLGYANALGYDFSAVSRELIAPPSLRPHDRGTCGPVPSRTDRMNGAFASV